MKTNKYNDLNLINNVCQNVIFIECVWYFPIDSTKLKFCSRCCVAKYCCVECQKKDHAFHKNLCRKFKAVSDEVSGLDPTNEQKNKRHLRYQLVLHFVVGIFTRAYYYHLAIVILVVLRLNRITKTHVQRAPLGPQKNGRCSEVFALQRW
jgi:hypothetical protein